MREFGPGQTKREGSPVILTRKELRRILWNYRAAIPADLEEELLAEYGRPFTDDEGHLTEYTEQDICEQLRKRLRPYSRAM
jgi:hypothetical protein